MREEKEKEKEKERQSELLASESSDNPLVTKPLATSGAHNREASSAVAGSETQQGPKAEMT